MLQPSREVTPYTELDRAAWAQLAETTESPLTAEEIERLRGLGDEIDIEEVREVYLPLSRILSLYVRHARALHSDTESFLGKPTVGRGANASLVGTTAGSDGTPQVTYNGQPLYLYAGDEKPGDTNGQGLTTFGALWWVLSPAGNQVTVQASSSGGGGSIYGGAAY